MQQARSPVKVEGLNGHILLCQSMQMIHLGLNSPYTIILTGVTHSFLDIRHFRNCTVHVVDTSAVYHGELVSLEQEVSDRGEAHFKLQLASSLHRLRHAANHAVFIDQSPVEILQAICKTNHIKAKFNLKNLEYRLPYTVQGDVSDYDFLLHVCMMHGIVFYYRHDQHEARLHFTNDAYHEECHELVFNPGNGLVNSKNTMTSIRYWQVKLPEMICLKGSQEGNPDVVFHHQTTNQTSIVGHGSLHLNYPIGFESQEDCVRYANQLQHQLDWQREWVKTEVVGLALQAGDRVMITNHPAPILNRSFRVLNVCASMDGSESNFSHPAKTTAYLITSERNYLLPQPDTVMPWQHEIHGEPPPGLMQSIMVALPSLTLAEIYGDNKNQTLLDEQGRYRVKRLLDSLDHTPLISHPVRQLQPVAGAHSGMHFPLKPGARVVLACLYNRLDKPIIMGVLPDPKQRSPVTEANRTQSLIRNSSGATMAFVDTEQTQQCALYTQDKQHGLWMTKQGEEESVLAKSLGGLDLEAMNEMMLHSGANVTLQSETALLNAKTDMSFTTLKTFTFNAKRITMQAEQDWLAQCMEGLVALSSTKTIEFISPIMAIEGCGITLHAHAAEINSGHQLTLTSQQHLVIQNNASQLSLHQGFIQFQAPHIIFNAQTILKNQGIEALVLSSFVPLSN
ncbi:contractile injection system protein, VgrG/Pvc8 family [Legionella impletisoli]|uniref:Gp5/Type VI secretion system Vgr protein OB-fold domain-containing protein n=1 Tax=Legionella impletisoli TaxID=343510 RepID=A0A917JRX9_9GAMM|nr:contractile injection system protein, VgrG/Pvc8 family [Legionella impletisoli]GGI83829.1 hypothetical protein GCM10007966_10540 [Legionella impletisoli]